MFAKVIVDINHSKVDRVFEYKIAQDQNAALGHRVLVPFGVSNKLVEGFVLEVVATSEYDESKIKPISQMLDAYPVLRADQIELAKHMQKVCGCTLADAFRLMLPGRLHGMREKTLLKVGLISEDTSSFYTKNGKVKAALQLKVATYLMEHGETRLCDLEDKIPGATASVRGMEKKNLVTVFSEQVIRQPYATAIEERKQVTLTTEQKYSVDTVCKSLFDGNSYLLHGVTGSGKTEVYLRIVDFALKQGYGAIVLVPEIALTPQAVERYRAMFGNQVALLHSRLSPGERFDQWRKILTGECNVVLGPRSAIFAPVEKLALVIVDEEHEGTYQSDTFPRYDAKEIGEYRISGKGSLILGSATPAIETYYDAVHRRIQLLELTQRANAMELPKTSVVDMANELLTGNKTIVSNFLFERIEERLKKHEQVVLLLNKRGYASFVMCRGCGHVLKCDHCDVSLAYHKADGSKVICHYCNNEAKVSRICPSCGRPFMKHFGIGTQQVEEQINKLFPDAKTLRMDFDTTRQKDSHYSIYNSFINHEADILIGTQMIAKGLDFPMVTLVGIVCADNMFNLPDYRAKERAFSLVTQASGRAGRGELSGEVVVQTYIKDNPTLAFAIAQDYKGFYSYEIDSRERMGYPPFAVFARIIASARSNDSAFDGIKGLNAKIFEMVNEVGENKLYYSCSPCPIGYLQDMHRYQILMKLRNTKESQEFLFKIRESVKSTDVGKNVYLDFEINPKNML